VPRQRVLNITTAMYRRRVRGSGTQTGEPRSVRRRPRTSGWRSIKPRSAERGTRLCTTRPLRLVAGTRRLMPEFGTSETIGRQGSFVTTPGTAI
jgi:hypothetical protein